MAAAIPQHGVSGGRHPSRRQATEEPVELGHDFQQGRLLVRGVFFTSMIQDVQQSPRRSAHLRGWWPEPTFSMVNQMHGSQVPRSDARRVKRQLWWPGQREGCLAASTPFLSHREIRTYRTRRSPHPAQALTAEFPVTFSLLSSQAVLYELPSK